MAEGPEARRLPVVASIVVALTLAIAPLPEAAQPFRPDWVLLTLIYWAVTLPRTVSVGTAWLTGLVLDVAQGTLLGQHALALSVVAYLAVRFHLQLRVFPLSQMTVTVAAMIGIYQFVLFWINGVAGLSVEGRSYWGPIVTGALAWPPVWFACRAFYLRARRN